MQWLDGMKLAHTVVNVCDCFGVNEKGKDECDNIVKSVPYIDIDAVRTLRRGKRQATTSMIRCLPVEKNR